MHPVFYLVTLSGVLLLLHLSQIAYRGEISRMIAHHGNEMLISFWWSSRVILLVISSLDLRARQHGKEGKTHHEYCLPLTCTLSAFFDSQVWLCKLREGWAMNCWECSVRVSGFCLLCDAFLDSAWGISPQICENRKNSLPNPVHSIAQLHQSNPRFSLLKLWFNMLLLP